MIIETIFWDLPNAQKLKITFRKRLSTQGNYYLVNVADMNLNCHKKLTPFEKYNYYGVLIYKERVINSNFPSYEDLKQEILHRYEVNIKF